MTRFTFANVERLEAAAGELDVPFEMDEDAFRAFYDRTSRAVWVYLARVTGDRQQADDLLQETYYRFLRVRSSFDSDEHRRHYLFRIATNLVHDHRRRAKHAEVPAAQEPGPSPDHGDSADRLARRIDVSRAMEQLKPRERSLLWLAYAQGWSHEEIASTLGLKTASLKSLLHRARRRLAAVLGNADRRGGRS
jgi:RNA polymerase sigma-70 factor (ECF subfamily)